MGANMGIRMKTPAHPGGFIRHEIIEPLGLSVTRSGGVGRDARDSFDAP